jgi:hypothetical protein
VSELAFTFRPDDHTYWLGNEQVLGCTECLKEVGILDDTWYDDRGTERGTVVHRYSAAVDRKAPKKIINQVAKPLYTNEWGGYAASWQIFVKAWVESWLMIETPLLDGQRRIAGSPDRVAIIRAPGVRHIGIPDLKTGDVEPWHRFQASIYILLVHTWMRTKATQLQRLYPFLDLTQPPLHYGVYLRSDGDAPKVRAFTYEPTTQAIITTAQVKRSLHRSRR